MGFELWISDILSLNVYAGTPEVFIVAVAAAVIAVVGTVAWVQR